MSKTESASPVDPNLVRDAAETDGFVEEIELRGHIIDSLILPKILDLIAAGGGTFRIKRITVGQSRNDPSYALVEIKARSAQSLSAIIAQVADHGAVPVAQNDCRLEAADVAGAFPENFYSTTNQRTEIRLGGGWVPVADQEMDCGIVVDTVAHTARCIPMTDVKIGMPLVVGHAGVRVFPEQRVVERTQAFEFMNSPVSTEKPKGVAIRQIAQQLFDVRRAGGKSLLVGGPAIIHTGSGPFVEELIRKHYISILFAGNAAGNARHRAIAVRYEPGCASGAWQPGRGGARASSAGDQPDSPLRRNSPGGGAGGARERNHV